MQAVPTNMRLRGTNPAIEVTASNVSFLLGETAPGGIASMSLRQGTTMSNAPPFFYVAKAPPNVFVGTATGAPGGAAICGTDIAASSFPTTALAALVEPYISLRTFSDREQARLTGAGLSCDSLTALSFTNLVGDYVTPSAFIPPSSAALARAYVDLSNQIVKASLVPPATAEFGALLDTYDSRSVLNPPTANALRGAFYTMSNLLALRLGAMASQIVQMVQSTSGNVLASLTNSIVAAAVAAASNDGNVIAGGYSDDDDDGCEHRENKVIVVYVNTSNVGGGGGGGGGGGNIGSGGPIFALVNDQYIYTPDGEARFYFSTSGTTTVASAGNRGVAEQLAFAWFVNDMQENIMELSGSGALWVRRTLEVGGNTNVQAGLSVIGQTALNSSLTVAGPSVMVGDTKVVGKLAVNGAVTMSNSATFLGDVALLGQSLTMGSEVEIRYQGSNIGINLPIGCNPVCALHVNGSVFSEEGLYELSDQSVKTDIEPLKDALDKCMRIRGCSYQRTDIPLRQIGVIAQNVNQVVPEAVHVGSDGRMSVAYGNLVALAIEAIREVSEKQLVLVERLERLEKGGAPPLNPPPDGGGGGRL